MLKGTRRNKAPGQSVHPRRRRLPVTGPPRPRKGTGSMDRLRRLVLAHRSLALLLVAMALVAWHRIYLARRAVAAGLVAQ